MLTPAEQTRYQKHLNLPEWGIEGQLTIKKSRVLVVGAGGLGCPVLLYLTAAGVGRIGVIDPDVVDLSNLQRQVLYTTSDIGQPKAKAAVAHLQRLNPDLRFDTHVQTLDANNARALIDSYDVVVDCTDNFGVRYLVNDWCVTLNKPFVYGAIHRFEGQVAIFNAELPDGQRGPTYRCVFPENPSQMEIPNCAETGVLGVLPGVIGTYQATEVLKLLTGIGEPLTDKLLMTDLLSHTSRTVKIRRQANAAEMARQGIADRQKPGLSVSDAPKKITARALADRLEQGESIFLLDVREREEYDLCHLDGAVLIPVGMIAATAAADRKRIPTNVPVVIYCHHGIRSANVANYLYTQSGYANLYNLEGGINAWAQQIEPEMATY
ncbi:molybdopterin-synthase adenylyltransferase MoeB [Fibrella aquatica]|uniref:molybdopterin-synthase adenylyltransferase MoeB n=1 Tax=Fibrella aquatica TaxID=3242487 RepID=UPI0035222AF5